MEPTKATILRSGQIRPPGRHRQRLRPLPAGSANKRRRQSAGQLPDRSPSASTCRPEDTEHQQSERPDGQDQFRCNQMQACEECFSSHVLTYPVVISPRAQYLAPPAKLRSSYSPVVPRRPSWHRRSGPDRRRRKSSGRSADRGSAFPDGQIQHRLQAFLFKRARTRPDGKAIASSPPTGSRRCGEERHPGIDAEHADEGEEFTDEARRTGRPHWPW